MRSEGATVGTCLIQVLVFALVNLVIGGLCAHYVVFVWLGKDIGMLASALIGLFGGELTIPAAAITFILQLVGAI